MIVGELRMMALVQRARLIFPLPLYAKWDGLPRYPSHCTGPHFPVNCSLP